MKKLASSKGGMNIFVIIILALLALIIFTLFLYKSYTNLQESLAVQNCKVSIAAHAIVLQDTYRTIATNIKCPTREIMIPDLSKAKDTIAEDIHRCWY